MTSTNSSSTADPSFLIGGTVYEDSSHEEAIGLASSSAMNTDSDSSRSNLNSIFSPVRKKTRNEDPTIPDASNNANVGDSHTKGSNNIDFCNQRYLFSSYSQDSNNSNCLPNYSQDGNLFTRMSMLNVASSQHSYADNHDNYYSGLVNQSCNHSNFSMPFTILNASQSLFNHNDDCNNTSSNRNQRSSSSSSSTAVGSEKDSNQPGLTMRNEPVDNKKSERSSNLTVGITETEREIDIPVPIRNGFLKGSRSHQERYFEQQQQHISRTTSRVKQPSKIWIGAFKERPRIVMEYEEIQRLGEGTFSTVSCVRHRLDGTLYAIKRLKENIYSEKQGALLVREACALAVLQGCPHIIRYFGCWLDNQHLYIKTELCHLGTLEDLVSPRPNPSSIIGMMHRKNNSNSSHPSQNSSNNSSSNHHRKSSNRSDSYDDSEDNMKLSDDRGFDSYIDRDHHQHNHQHQLLAGSELSNELTVSYQDDVPIAEQPRRGVREELAWLVLFEMSCALKYIHERELAHLDLRPANIFLTTSAGYRDNMDDNAFVSQRIQLSPDEKGPVFSSSSSSSTSSSVSLFDSILNARSLHETQKVSGDTTTADHVCIGSGRSRGEEEEEDDDVSSSDPRLHVERLLLMRGYVMKLGDFGHCCRFDERHVVEEGATRYCAGELIKREGGAVDLYKADIFSLGSLVYELCLGRFLGSNGEEWRDIRDGNLSQEFINSYSSNLTDLLKLLLHPMPMKRPSAEHLADTLVRSSYPQLGLTHRANVIFGSHSDDHHHQQQQQDQLIARLQAENQMLLARLQQQEG